jgi:hypothetical protein
VADKDSQAVSGEVVNDESGMAVLSPSTLATIDALASLVPEGGGDAIDRMAAQILGAPDASSLDAPWRSIGLKALNRVPVLVTAIKRLPSDFDQGLGFFLVVTLAIRSTGEVLNVTTGSAFVVLQLLRAWGLEQANPGTVFPWGVTPIVADKSSANGFYPMHLEVTR